MKTLSTYKRSLWRYILVALWLCGTLTTWGQTVLERGDVAGRRNTLKKKVLFAFSFLFISSFLSAQVPNPIILEWAFPAKLHVTNPTSTAKDAIWFAPSTNNYPTLFDALPASYGSGLERNVFSGCAADYFGVASGINSCIAPNNDYSIIAKDWPTGSARSSNDYIEFEFDIENMECYDFSNSTGVISFDAKRSSQGPTKIDVYAVATHPLFGEIQYPFPNSTNLTVEFEDYPLPSWYSFSIDSSGIHGFNNLFDLVQNAGLDNIEIRIYGYSAGSGSGTLRIDNFKLQLNDATLDQSPSSFNDLSYPSEVCLESDLPVLNNLPENSNESAGEWSLGIEDNIYTYTFTPTNECYEAYSFTVSVEDVITPNFVIPPGQCEGESFPLGNESPNGITGTWSPAFDPYNTTTYTFTPDAGQCASTQEVTIIIKDKPITSPIQLLN